MIRLIRSFDWSSRNRLYLVWWRDTWQHCGLALEYGNRNSDPVWSIGIERCRR